MYQVVMVTEDPNDFLMFFWILDTTKAVISKATEGWSAGI